jgi:SOS response regulatory protein OraA/RecX
MDDVVGQVDDDALLEAAIARRLRNRERTGDDHELQRLYQHLLRQGFEPEKVSRALRTRRPLRADGFDTDL